MKIVQEKFNDFTKKVLIINRYVCQRKESSTASETGDNYTWKSVSV